MIKKKLFVIKIGGNVIDEPVELEQFLKDFSKIQSPKILIHGGGKIATQLADKMGIETIMKEGRRVTDKATIEIVTMVYGGLINKNIVAKLQVLNNNAIGLTGADAKTVTAQKRPANTFDYGYVGDIESVNSETINQFLSIGLIPIFAPLTADSNGQILNTNADTMAQAIAVAMANIYDTSLVYCFEKNGVLLDAENNDSVIENLTFETFQQLKNEGKINKGMIPKLDNAFLALNKGVKKVMIGNAQKLSQLSDNKHIGTILGK